MPETESGLEVRTLRHEFSDTEMLEMGKALARVAERAAALESERESFNTSIKAKIKLAAAEAETLSIALNKQYELRAVECIVEYHRPHNGEKTITRTDTGEIVDVETMDAQEMQEQLPLGG